MVSQEGENMWKMFGDMCMWKRKSGLTGEHRIEIRGKKVLVWQGIQLGEIQAGGWRRWPGRGTRQGKGGEGSARNHGFFLEWMRKLLTKGRLGRGRSISTLMGMAT